MKGGGYPSFWTQMGRFLLVWNYLNCLWKVLIHFKMSGCWEHMATINHAVENSLMKKHKWAVLRSLLVIVCQHTAIAPGLKVIFLAIRVSQLMTTIFFFKKNVCVRRQVLFKELRSFSPRNAVLTLYLQQREWQRNPSIESYVWNAMGRVRLWNGRSRFDTKLGKGQQLELRFVYVSGIVDQDKGWQFCL